MIMNVNGQKFSDWLAGHYTSIDEEELRQYIQQRLKVIYRNFDNN